jgi:hypothetical protein
MTERARGYLVDRGRPRDVPAAPGRAGHRPSWQRRGCAWWSLAGRPALPAGAWPGHGRRDVAVVGGLQANRHDVMADDRGQVTASPSARGTAGGSQRGLSNLRLVPVRVGDTGGSR